MLLGLLSAGTGLYFGNMSEKAYTYSGHAGSIGGALLGLWVGLCYAALVTNRIEKLKNLKILGFAFSVGMATGVICSTLVHIVLIIVNEETNFYGIVIGIPISG